MGKFTPRLLFAAISEPLRISGRAFEIIFKTSYLCLYYSYKLNFNGYRHIFDYARLRLPAPTFSEFDRHLQRKIAATKTGGRSGNNS